MAWQDPVSIGDGGVVAALPDAAIALPPSEMFRLCVVGDVAEAERFHQALLEQGVPVELGEAPPAQSDTRRSAPTIELLVPDALYDRACEVIARLQVASIDDDDEWDDDDPDDDDDDDDEDDDDDDDEDDFDDDDDDEFDDVGFKDDDEDDDF